MSPDLLMSAEALASSPLLVMLSQSSILSVVINALVTPIKKKFPNVKPQNVAVAISFILAFIVLASTSEISLESADVFIQQLILLTTVSWKFADSNYKSYESSKVDTNTTK